jgi:hypothetical protein
MRIASKRHTYIFKYTDVESVTYKPMKLFTKQKGFTVKITTKNNEVIFRYIMPSNAEFFTIESTPFYILQHPPIKAEERKDRWKKYCYWFVPHQFSQECAVAPKRLKTRLA